MQNPIKLVARALWLFFSGRTSLARTPQRDHLVSEGERFTAFRKVTVDPDDAPTDEPGAIFQVRFKFKNLSAAANRKLSLLPIPLIVAQPGFRSKTWLLGLDSGDFIGHYEFDTFDQAEAYYDSLPLRMMRKRAAPGSLTYEINAAA
jgi:hypothetical protein